MQPLVLYGAGGLARESLALIRSINRNSPMFDLIGFVVDNDRYQEGKNIHGLPILGDYDWLVERRDSLSCTCAIGDPRPRARIQESLQHDGVRMASLIDPYAWITPGSIVGKGSIIFSDVKVSVDCELGEGVFLNCGVTVGHDAKIGNYTCVMPGTGISGKCTIGNRVSIGGHAFITPNKRIGDDAVIAAGSIVFSNVKEGTTVLGNPAKRMKALE